MRQISRTIGRPLASFEKKISDDIAAEIGHGFQPFVFCSKCSTSNLKVVMRAVSKNGNSADVLT